MKMIIQLDRKFNMIPSFSLPLTFILLCFGMLGVPDLYAGESVVVYSGRAERLIKPVLDHFQQTTGTTGYLSPPPMLG